MNTYVLCFQEIDLDDGLGMFVLAEVFVDSDGGAFAITHAVDDQPWAEDAIAAGENSGRRGHQRLRVHRDQAAWRQFQPCLPE